MAFAVKNAPWGRSAGWPGVGMGMGAWECPQLSKTNCVPSSSLLLSWSTGHFSVDHGMQAGRFAPARYMRTEVAMNEV